MIPLLRIYTRKSILWVCFVGVLGCFVLIFLLPLATVSTSKTKVYLDLMYEKFSALILP